MVDAVEKFGGNAGNVWVQLRKRSPLTPKQIASRTKLSTDEVHCAIGWLAREGKIYVSGEGRTPRFGLVE